MGSPRYVRDLRDVADVALRLVADQCDVYERRLAAALEAVSHNDPWLTDAVEETRERGDLAAVGAIQDRAVAVYVDTDN
eukprot:8440400-Pyramimonas_sp.AAC.1